MVAGVFPVSKLLYLLFRHITKPIANYAKERAKTHPFFRTRICLPIAQFYHWGEVKVKMWRLDVAGPINIPPLNEKMAIELGANVLSEFIVFGSAAFLLIIEAWRQAANTMAKEKEEEIKMNEIRDQIQELSLQLMGQEAQLREMFRVVSDLESRRMKIWRTRSEAVNEEDSDLGAKYQAKKGVIMEAISYIQDDLFKDSRT